MTARGSVGSLVESHRAKATRPDHGLLFTPKPPASTRSPIFPSYIPNPVRATPSKLTAVKASAAAAYEHILTIHNAANLEFPATDPANARE